MRNGYFAGAVVCFGLLGPNMAHAAETVTSFLQAVDEPLDHSVAVTRLSGIYSGLSQANSYLADDRREAPIYCVPEQLALTEDQMVSLLRKSVQEDAQMGQMPVSAALLVVMKKTFPCAAAAK
ncbi:MAG: hypothetical protein ACREHV_12690 [Rhizomicrobium sp.]